MRADPGHGRAHRAFSLLAALPCVLAVVLAACGDPPTAPEPLGPVAEITELPRGLSETETALIGAANRFTFDLLKRTARPDSNLFISPLSASMALGMTMNGTDGETRDQMRRVLGFGDRPLEEINTSYRGLVDLLVGLDATVETVVANSVWSRRGFPVRPEFADVVKEAFGAEVAELDFADPAAPRRINGWVEDATRGKIASIVPDPIPGWVVMYLVNALYFKGTWTFRFDPDDTEEAPFHRADGTTAPVRLMELEGALPFRSADRYQAVDLPYGGRAFAMTVILPRAGEDLGGLIAYLDARAWTEMVEGLSETSVHLRLPRFRMTWGGSLKEPLKALGMVDAFSSRADFSRLSPASGLLISEVRHKGFVEVNEEGTEAAAATSVEIGIVSVDPGPVEMRVDRPFLFVIRERLSGTILFVGTMVEPPAG